MSAIQIENEDRIINVIIERLCAELRLCAENRWLDDGGEAEFERKYARLEHLYRDVIYKIAKDILRDSDAITLSHIMRGHLPDRFFITQLHDITKFLHYHD
jgi:hypothetical protein